MTRGRGGARGGFTLMETVVTLVLMSVIAAAGYATFATLIDQRARLRAAMVETERAAALRTMLEDWFARSITGPISSSAPGMGSLGSGPSKDMFSFITRAPAPSIGFANVALLYIDDNPATPQRGLTLRYLSYSAYVGVPWLTFSNAEPAPSSNAQLRQVGGQQPDSYQLDSTVVGLRVEFLSPVTGRWYRASDAARVQSERTGFQERNGPGGLGRSGGFRQTGGVARITLEGAPNAPLPRLLQLPFLITRVDQGNR